MMQMRHYSNQHYVLQSLLDAANGRRCPLNMMDAFHSTSAGLRYVEAPGQQCYRQVVDVMSIST